MKPESAFSLARPRMRALVLIAFASSLASCDEPERPKPPAPPPPAAAPAPPPPPPVAEPTPPAEPPPEATPPPMDPIAAALLGTNKKPSSDGAVLRASRQPQIGVDRAVKPRPARDAAPAEPEEQPDEPVEPEIATTLTDTRFSSIVANWRGVKDCLGNALLAERTDRTGALSVAFVIGPDGVVKESKIIDTSNDLARQIAPCVSKQAKKIRFPTYAGTEDVAKEAKFVF